ncbi:GIY-YIG nuclease family protein [Nocardioides marmoriginsengisoli]|uniref:GIY-YIG nuclease family protein n=1 Tax=Nocardioides marmoriginsengisoli TaxID=661483 RepID=UPI0011CEC700|nr:GIY-YIG nuclease family protein [Nocardioides marmoriginsengisoli]
MRTRRREPLAERNARLEAQHARLAVAPHYVYRAFDEFGVLLYIGCTVDIHSRLNAHRGSSPWRRFMARFETEPFAGLAAARAAESAAILAEVPLFNSTSADIARTQANRNEARRRLGDIGIYSPQFDVNDSNVETFAESDEWATYCAESSAYQDLVNDVRAELKAGDCPYLTPEDRLALYMEIRTGMQSAVAA